MFVTNAKKSARRVITRKFINFWLCFILVFSVFHLMPFSDRLIGNVSADSTWVQTSESDFSNGTTNDVVVTSDGKLELALRTDHVEDEYWDGVNYITDIDRTYGGDDYETCYSMKHTKDGGYVLTGYTQSFGTDAPKKSLSKINGWVVKTNSKGNTEWTSAIGGYNYDYARDIQETSDGGYVMTGYTYGNVWLVKINSTGVMQWQRTFDAGYDDRGYSVEETSDGGFIITGQCEPGRPGWGDLLLLKTDKNGKQEWRRTWGINYKQDNGNDVLQTKDGGYIIIGSTYSYGAGGYDAWLIKTNATGVAQWKKTYGGSNSDSGVSVLLAKDGGYIFAGSTYSYGAGDFDAWLVKTDSSGKEQWNMTYGGLGGESGTDVQHAPDGGYILSGSKENFGYKNCDVWLIKVDSSGQEEWNRTYGSTNWECAYSVQTTSDGGYAFGGTKYVDGAKSEFWLVRMRHLAKDILENGEWTSTNMLSGKYTQSITYFNYTATIPSGTLVKVQFSKDNSTWYNSKGVKGGWDSINKGSNSIDLARLDWAGSSFYYKLNFTTLCRTDPVYINFKLYYEQYISSGTFISAPFDSQCFSKWTYLAWNATTPEGTKLKFQLRTGYSKEDLLGSAFVGPDGKTSTYYTTSVSEIWPGHNYDRWVQFKIYLETTKPDATPVVESVTIGYKCIPGIPQLVYPSDGLWINDSTPMFNWTFLCSGYKQYGFQVLIDDEKSFGSVNFDSGKRCSKNHYWQFPQGTNYTDIPDGTYYWKVRTKDSCSCWHPYSHVFKFTVDATPPVSKIVQPIDGNYYRSFYYISGTVMDPDNGSGVNRVDVLIKRSKDKYTWNGSGWDPNENWLKATGTKYWYYIMDPYTWDNCEKYTIYSRGVDNVGNIEKPVNSSTFIVDRLPPESYVDYPSDGYYNHGFDVIRGRAVDFGCAGLKVVRIAIQWLPFPPPRQPPPDDPFWDGKRWVVTNYPIWLVADGTSTWSYNASAVTWPDGIYTIHTRAIDNAGNYELNTAKVFFRIEKVPPAININDGGMLSIWHNDMDRITGTTSDDRSGITGVTLNITYDQVFHDRTCAVQGGQWSTDISDIEWPNDREQKINLTATARDLAGNTAIDRSFFLLDTKKPVSDIGSPANNSQLTLLHSIEGTATDNGAGIKELAISIKRLSDNRYWSGFEWVFKKSWIVVYKTGHYPKYDKNIDWVYDTTKIDWVSGKYLIRLKASDGAWGTASKNGSNVEIPSYGTVFEIDNKPPAVSMAINNGDKFTNSNKVKLDLNAKDDYSGLDKVSLSIDNTTWSSWESYTSKKDYTLITGDGTKHVYCRVMDKFGNIGYAHNSIILDTASPKNLSITIDGGAAQTNSTKVTLTLAAIDQLSGVDQMSFSSDGNTWSTWEEFTKTRSYQLSSGDGTKTVHFRVRDSAGNIAKPVSDTIVLNSSYKQGSGNDDKKIFWPKFEFVSYTQSDEVEINEQDVVHTGNSIIDGFNEPFSGTNDHGTDQDQDEHTDAEQDDVYIIDLELDLPPHENEDEKDLSGNNEPGTGEMDIDDAFDDKPEADEISDLFLPEDEVLKAEPKDDGGNDEKRNSLMFYFALVYSMLAIIAVAVFGFHRFWQIHKERTAVRLDGDDGFIVWER
jgi:hypothetical protein